MERYWVPSNLRSALFGTDVTDYWFPVAQGGDIAFLYGVIKILIEEKWYDEAFVRDHSADFDELVEAAGSRGWAELEKGSRPARAAACASSQS